MRHEWEATATTEITYKKYPETIVDGYVIDDGIETEGTTKGIVTCDGKPFANFTLEGISQDCVMDMLYGYDLSRSLEMSEDISDDVTDIKDNLADFYENDIQDFDDDEKMPILHEIIKDAVFLATPSDTEDIIVEFANDIPLQ